MAKLVRGLTILIIAFMAVTVAYAQQGPRGRWWRDSKVVKQLRLTDSDIEQLEEAWKDSRARMIKLKSRVEEEQFKLQTLIEKRKLDEKAVKAQNRRLEEARTALADERTAFVLEVRKIIGHDRFQLLLELNE